FTGDWTHVAGATVVDATVASNRFFQAQPNPALHNYKPTSVGLPSYLDSFCAAAGDCRLPVVNINGYQGISRAAVSDDLATHIQERLLRGVRSGFLAYQSEPDVQRRAALRV